MPPSGSDALAPERIHEAAARALADASLQRELPLEAQPAGELPLEWLALLFRILLVAAAAVAVTLAVTWLVRRLRGRVRDVEGPPTAPVATVEIPVALAESLAAAGRYGEAIHALLLETLAALSTAARLAPALTSREIVARVPLAPRARDALAALVGAVEISHFGGAAPDERDYRSCLDRFRLFLDSYRSAA